MSIASTPMYAGFWVRLGAFCIDCIITYAIGFAVGILMNIAAPTLMTGSSSTQVAQLLGTGINWLYFAGMESSLKQGTVGKFVLGLQVIDVAGQRLSFLHATGRFFGKIVCGLTLGAGFVMIAFTQKKQGLHDLIASTLVVKTK